ncbi:hypothetical protein J6590_093934, partial [Homalodisca vitripennis]
MIRVLNSPKQSRPVRYCWEELFELVNDDPREGLYEEAQILANGLAHVTGVAAKNCKKAVQQHP